MLSEVTFLPTFASEMITVTNVATLHLAATCLRSLACVAGGFVAERAREQASGEAAKTG